MNTKQSDRCFFDAQGIVQKAHCRIDRALWVLWRSKVPCHRGIERQKNIIINCVHMVGFFIGIKHIAGPYIPKYYRFCFPKNRTNQFLSK